MCMGQLTASFLQNLSPIVSDRQHQKDNGSQSDYSELKSVSRLEDFSRNWPKHWNQHMDHPSLAFPEISKLHKLINCWNNVQKAPNPQFHGTQIAQRHCTRRMHSWNPVWFDSNIYYLTLDVSKMYCWNMNEFQLVIYRSPKVRSNDTFGLSLHIGYSYLCLNSIYGLTQLFYKIWRIQNLNDPNFSFEDHLSSMIQVM